MQTNSKRSMRLSFVVAEGLLAPASRAEVPTWPAAAAAAGTLRYTMNRHKLTDDDLNA